MDIYFHISLAICFDFLSVIFLGSHGAGDDHETQTPFVLWGAGTQPSNEGPLDPETESMSLNHRFDIKQADLTPLMSTILSIPVPVNSIVNSSWLTLFPIFLL